MEGKQLALIISRAFQLLCAAVVLGTGVSLSKWFPQFQKECNASTLPQSYCNFHHLIPALEFSAAVGAFGLIDAIVGLVGIFLDMVPYIISLGLDGLAALAYLAGGISVAVTLANDGGNACSTSKCTEIRADDAFQFIGLIVTVVLIALGFMWQRGSGKLHSAV